MIKSSCKKFGLCRWEKSSVSGGGVGDGGGYGYGIGEASGDGDWRWGGIRAGGGKFEAAIGHNWRALSTVNQNTLTATNMTVTIQ
ncbi:hypothetical protein F0562_028110 [Nyssa sinensis]|uniref:Uncharacterized protein n=1 Tax=Nyssa sinensis TaxID=561372 RepID=A0A5J5B739_9ASTE|nr:hypothetical protein F0562_028110 [Nyssa sinensis]